MGGRTRWHWWWSACAGAVAGCLVMECGAGWVVGLAMAATMFVIAMAMCSPPAPSDNHDRS